MVKCSVVQYTGIGAIKLRFPPHGQGTGGGLLVHRTGQGQDMTGIGQTVSLNRECIQKHIEAKIEHDYTYLQKLVKH